MKKSLLSVLIITTSIIQPTFPSLAKDCPTISETVKEVTVKNPAATLRKEPKHSTKNKGPAINTDDKLTVILRKPELGQDKEKNTHCWYKVRPVNTSAQEDYWIADIGISEFPFEVKETLSQSQSQSSTSLGNENQEGQNTNQVPENQNKSQVETQEFATPSWLILALAGVGVLSSLGTLAFSSLMFFSQKKKISSISDDVYEIRKNIQQLSNQIIPKISSQNNSQLDSYYRRAKAKFQGISDQIIELKQFNLSALSQPKSFFTSPPASSDYPPAQINNYSYSESVFPSENDELIPTLKREIDEVIKNFNAQNRAYFDSRFHPLGLTKASSQGLVGEDGHRIIQLESFNDVSKDLFLQIMLDGENWLIPNINSSYIRQIMNNLEQYPEIFSIKSDTGKPTLIRPAKLKEVSSGLWEIAEIGEFET